MGLVCCLVWFSFFGENKTLISYYLGKQWKDGKKKSFAKQGGNIFIFMCNSECGCNNAHFLEEMKHAVVIIFMYLTIFILNSKGKKVSGAVLFWMLMHTPQNYLFYIVVLQDLCLSWNEWKMLVYLNDYHLLFLSSLTNVVCLCTVWVLT